MVSYSHDLIGNIVKIDTKKGTQKTIKWVNKL
jgi:hypothetical protein